MEQEKNLTLKSLDKKIREEFKQLQVEIDYLKHQIEILKKVR